MMNFLILGVGGAGCRFLDTCSRLDENLPECLAVHTDQQVLDSCAVDNKILLGSSLLRGDSTGGDSNLGRQAVESDSGQFGEHFQNVDMVFLVTGLGGGTGTGVAPQLAMLARECGATVLCFAIQPFFFEGSTKLGQAKAGLRELRDAADAVVELSNQTILNWANENIGVEDAFEKVNIALLRNLSATIDLLAYPGVVANVSFSDFAALLKHSGGVCVMGYGEGEGEGRLDAALSAVVTNPVLGREDIVKKASGLIVGILGGSDMTVFEVRNIMETITEMARTDVHISMGAVIRPNWSSKIGIAIFASEKWEDAVADQTDDSREKTSEEVRAESSGSGKTKRVRQSKLSLQPKGKGCFNNVEPTRFDGEDLDIPTFKRGNIKLS